MTLFAESDWADRIVTFAVGGGLAATAAAIAAALKGRRAASKEDRRDALTELQTIITRQDRELGEVRDEVRELRADKAMCDQRAARQAVQITWLQDALRNAKIPFREFDPDESGPHPPIERRNPRKSAPFDAPHRRADDPPEGQP